MDKFGLQAVMGCRIGGCPEMVRVAGEANQVMVGVVGVSPGTEEGGGQSRLQRVLELSASP